MADEREARRGIVRRAMLLTASFLGAAVAVALGGAALIARLALPDMPFLAAWLLVLGVVVLGVLMIVAVQTVLARRRGGE